MDFVSLALILVFLALIGLVTGALAARKGYNFVNWFFAGGIIGLLFLAFLPDIRSKQFTDIERIALKEKGDVIGRNVAIVSCVLALLRSLIG